MLSIPFTMTELIRNSISDSIEVKQLMLTHKELLHAIETCVDAIVSSLDKGGKVILAGNGGSCTDAFHLAGEFVGRFKFDRRPLPALALGGNIASTTAIGNDYSYNDIFDRELQALGKSGDVLLLLSTSGNSENIIQLIHTALAQQITVFGFTGLTGGKMGELIPCFKVPSSQTPRIQESHIMIGHIICELVEKKMCTNQNK